MPVRSEEYFGVKDLFSSLKEAGIVKYTLINNFRAGWLFKLEKQGRLVCPRSATNLKHRLFTQKQIEEICEAFRPGGVGSWSYLE